MIVNRSGNPNINNVPTSSVPALIPRDTFLIVELESGLSTESTQQGDRFEARVIEPAEYQGAILEGRVTRVKRPGRVKGVAELQLSFNRIRMPDNRSGNIAAELVEVVSTGRHDEGQVDREGGVRGKKTRRKTMCLRWARRLVSVRYWRDYWGRARCCDRSSYRRWNRSRWRLEQARQRHSS